MRVLLNAVSVKEGGPLTVLLRLLEAMIALDPAVEWHVVVHPEVSNLLPKVRSQRRLLFPWADRTPAHLLFWYNWILPSLVRRFRPDILFSQTNYLPHRPVTCPTLLLEQHAGHFSGKFQQLMEASLGNWPAKIAWRFKTSWVRQSVKLATLLTVQTQSLANAVVEQTGVPHERIRAIPHGPGLVEPAAFPHRWPDNRTWRIGFVAKPGVQKNFGVLFDAVRRLLQDGQPVSLVLSLDENTTMFTPIRTQIRHFGIGGCIDNMGDVEQNQVSAIYDSLDLFVFPSLCESFGFPLVEAMSRGVPVLVADTPGNREVTAEAALRFSPRDGAELAARIASLMGDRNAYERRAKASLWRGRSFSWDGAAKFTLAALRQAAGEGIA